MTKHASRHPATVVAVFGAARLAQAHPTLLLTSPAADTGEAVSRSSLVLVFNEPVTIAAQALSVADAAGRLVAGGLHVIAYYATPDVSRELVAYIAGAAGRPCAVPAVPGGAGSR